MSAILSPCRKYRYLLMRDWAAPDVAKRVLGFMMLNPPTADEHVNDATIRKCIGFARQNGCNGIMVVNLYGYRATQPNDLHDATDAVGPDNDKWIKYCLIHTDIAVCAWGAHKGPDMADRVREVMALINRNRTAAGPVVCLSRTRDGSPGHPLMLSYARPLLLYP